MKLLWLDLETTGLDPVKDLILEVAARVTTLDRIFDVTDRYEAVIRTHGAVLESCAPLVREMHTKSGLFDACANHEMAVRIWEAEHELLCLVDRDVPIEERTVIAGSTPAFDLSFVRLHMPTLAKHLHYRTFDASTLVLAARAYGMPRPEKALVHRAAADIDESMRLAQDAMVYLANVNAGP